LLLGNLMLPGTYDHRLVALSVAIALCASYGGLDLADRVTAARGRVRAIWLIGGATAMGLGIWCMDYIGMLAFSLPVPVLYDWPMVLLSLVAAILASAVALYAVSLERMNLWRVAVGSTVVGAGIATMHYTGMAAMRVAAICHYDASLVALSIALAIVISFVALWLAILARKTAPGAVPRKIVGATVMGLGIPAVHYVGMAAASFMAASVVPDVSHAASITTLGAAGVTTVTMMILSLAVLTSILDRRFAPSVGSGPPAPALP